MINKMQITDQQLDAFIQIYQKNFGVVLDRASALAKGIKLAEFVELILKSNYASKDKKLNKT